MFRKLTTRSIAVAALVALTGCASIVSNSNWPVTIQSNPTGAKCVVSKANGTAIQTGEAPMTLNLPSSKGYFSSAEYSIVCQKEGFQPAQSTLSGHLNGWYLGGNLVFGGLIGWLIVDPATGAMWRLDESLTVNLLEMAKTTEAKQPAATLP